MFWLRICVMLAHLEGVIGLLDGEERRVGILVVEIVEIVGMVVLDRVVAAI